MGKGNGDGKIEPAGDASGTLLDRRGFIRIGTAALAAAAGCTDAGDDTDGADDEPTDRPPMAVRDATVNETAVFTDESLEVRATVVNEGDRPGTFHAELRMDDVIVETKAVDVDPGEREPVTFTGTFGEPGEYEVRVNDAVAGTVRVERPPPEFEVREAELADRTVAVGQQLAVRATIANVGGREGAASADLQVNGRTVETRELTIDAGEEESMTITHAFDAPGRYAIGLNGTDVGTVTVERPAAFEMRETALSEPSVGVGEPVTVTARIANVGEQRGTVGADLLADGEPVATSEATIDPGETATVRFSPTFEKRGAYELRVESARRGPAGSRASGDRAGVGRVYVTACEIAVSETVTVDSGSASTYAFDLSEHAEIGITTRTREGVDPTLTVVGPSEAPVEDASDDPLEVSLTTSEAGRYEIRLANDALLPWREGTWAVEIELCTWRE